MASPDAQKWLEALLLEINNLIANGTWEICDLLSGMHAIGCKWIFAIKHNPDGSIERYKVRLVAKGFSQRPGYDYVETFAPTVRMATIRTVLALAALEDLELHSLDISQAFINGDLDTEIYMEMPEGWDGAQKGKVLCLKKALYGLKLLNFDVLVMFLCPFIPFDFIYGLCSTQGLCSTFSRVHSFSS